MNKFLIGCFICASNSLAYSAPTLVTPQITGLNLGWGGEAAYFQITASDSSQGCAASNELVLPATGVVFKESLAIILSGVANGKTLQLWINGCYNDRPQIIGAGFSNN